MIKKHAKAKQKATKARSILPLAMACRSNKKQVYCSMSYMGTLEI